MFKSRLNLRNVTVACIAAIMFSGCDAHYDYIFKVANQTGVSVRVEAVGYNNRDEVFSIPAGEIVTIFREGGMTGSAKYVPEDRYQNANSSSNLPPIKKFEVYVGNTLLSDSVRLRKYWDYSAQKLLGTYTLIVTEKLLEDLGME